MICTPLLRIDLYSAFAELDWTKKQNQGTDQENQSKSGVQIILHVMICTLDFIVFLDLYLGFVF